MLFSALMLTSVIAMPQGEAGNDLTLLHSVEKQSESGDECTSTRVEYHTLVDTFDEAHLAYLIADENVEQKKQERDYWCTGNGSTGNGARDQCESTREEVLVLIGAVDDAKKAVNKAKEDKIEAHQRYNSLKCDCPIDQITCPPPRPPSPSPSPSPSPPPSPPPPCPKTQGCDDSCTSSCDSSCDDHCDGDCDDSCDFFSKSCDGGCDGGCNGSCDNDCNEGCNAGCDEPDPSCAAHTATFLEEKHEAASWADRLHAAKAKMSTLAAAKSKKHQDPMHRH